MANTKSTHPTTKRANELVDKLGISQLAHKYNEFRKAVNKHPVQKQTVMRYVSGYDHGAPIDFTAFVYLYRG